MSQSPRSRKGSPRPAAQPSPALAAVSALIVIGVFIALGLMLSQRGTESAASAQPTPDAFAYATQAAQALTPAAQAPTPAAQAPTAAAQAPDTSVAARADMYSAAPPMSIDVNKSYTATITTPRGDIVIKLRPDLAPQTVNSFVFLAREGYYDGVTWHRVLQNFMAQGGDPTGTGGGGPGYTIPAEFTNQVLFDKPGIVAMARPGNDVNGNGSQFFITTAPYPSLNEQYTVFGEVISGQEIVDGIPLRDPSTASAPGEQMLKVTIAEQ